MQSQIGSPMYLDSKLKFQFLYQNQFPAKSSWISIQIWNWTRLEIWSPNNVSLNWYKAKRIWHLVTVCVRGMIDGMLSSMTTVRPPVAPFSRTQPKSQPGTPLLTISGGENKLYGRETKRSRCCAHAGEEIEFARSAALRQSIQGQPILPLKICG